MSPPDRRRLTALLVLLAICAACGPAPTPSRPTTTGSLLPAATSAASATTSAAASPAFALPPTACLTLAEEDCRLAAEVAIAGLPSGVAAPIYLQVGPFWCRVGERCPRTLAARPEGDVIVESAGLPAIAMHLTTAPDGSLRSAAGEAFGVRVGPSSARVDRPGPMSFTLGHCGLYSGIDADGSWWDPVGIIDIEHADAINAAVGSLVFRDPTHASFMSQGGLALELLRRVGPKHLPGCD